jgi:hypothetical protein
MGLSFTTACGLASAVILMSESRGTHDHILLSQVRDSSNLEGQVPSFKSPRNRIAQLYTQALGSLFVTSYESQGYGGGIRPSLHTGSPSSLESLKSLHGSLYRLAHVHGIFCLLRLSV